MIGSVSPIDRPLPSESDPETNIRKEEAPEKAKETKQNPPPEEDDAKNRIAEEAANPPGPPLEPDHKIDLLG